MPLIALLHGPEAAFLSGAAKGEKSQWRSDERTYRYHPLGSSKTRQHESVNAALDGPRQKFGESHRIVLLIEAPECSEIFRAVRFVDDGWGVPIPDKRQVQEKSPRSTVSIEERVNLLKTGMGERETDHRMDPLGLRRTTIDRLQPISHLGWHFRPRWRSVSGR
jgi:hypothetical protein